MGKRKWINRCTVSVAIFAIFMHYPAGVYAQNANAQASGYNIQKLEYPKEYALYRAAFDAAGGLSKPSENFGKNSLDILHSGWVHDEEVIRLLGEYRKAIDMFKEATRQVSDGTMFGVRPVVLDATTEIPNFSNAIPLMQLTLLEAKKLEAEGDLISAEENYIAAARFVLHLAQQEFKCLLISLIEMVNLDILLTAITDVIEKQNHQDSFYRELRAILNQIHDRPDFMEGTIRLEAEVIKSVVPMMRKEDFNDVGRRDKMMKLLPRKATARFLAEVEKKFNYKVDDLFGCLVTASKNNTPRLCEAQINAHKERMERLRNQNVISQIGAYIRERFKGRSDMDIKAERLADILFIIAMPSYLDAIDTYHVVYNRLNVTAAGLALSLYQKDKGHLPVNLNELVPGYLTAVGKDTFNNFAPLQYSTKGKTFTIYSYGPNRVDDAGEQTFDVEHQDWSSGDISFQYTIP